MGTQPCQEHPLLPAMTRSTAYSKSNVWTDECPSRAACSAASLQMLAMSAPVSTRQEILLPQGLPRDRKAGAQAQGSLAGSSTLDGGHFLPLTDTKTHLLPPSLMPACLPAEL